MFSVLQSRASLVDSLINPCYIRTAFIPHREYTMNIVPSARDSVKLLLFVCHSETDPSNTDFRWLWVLFGILFAFLRNLIFCSFGCFPVNLGD